VEDAAGDIPALTNKHRQLASIRELCPGVTVLVKLRLQTSQPHTGFNLRKAELLNVNCENF